MQNIAVLGAKTLVGRELIAILEQRDYPVRHIYLHDTSAGDGEQLLFKGKKQDMVPGYEGFLDKVDLVFCCADRVGARSLINKFKQKSLVIDLSGASSFMDGVPCLIPEFHMQDLEERKGVLANPRPMTILLLLPLQPLHEKFKLNHLCITGLISVSDYGVDALAELNYEYEFLAVDEELGKSEYSVFPHTIGSNMIPQVGDLDNQGHTEEENLLVREIKGILRGEEIRISSTFIWSPVKRANCAVVYASFEKEISVNDARKVLKSTAGVKLMRAEEYPTPEHVIGKDEVFVGRLRQDLGFPSGLAMWIVADNLRKGSALNAVQIAEKIFR
jgi:aspartate-semialdehyde dehydrogenase